MGICFSIEHQTLQQQQQQQHEQEQEQEQSLAKTAGGYDPATSSHKQDNNNNNNGHSPWPNKTATTLPYSHKNVKDLRENPSYTNVHIFTYTEMILATKNFRPDFILGEGGFGVVYKGVIDQIVRPGYTTTNVAIKVLNPDGVQGVGCVLTWSKRMRIALDAARGLAFLHDAERPIIYRDFKTSNILLNENFNAKLSDFGLAKEGPTGDQTHVSTRVMGTYGYAAPEYVMTGHLTARSDVYGFGVVLLEMLLGRRAMDRSRPSREHNLVEWARPLLNHNKKVLRIFDPRMDGQYSAKTAMKVANLAYQCLSQNPKSRPLMSEVVEFLEDFQTPEENNDDAMLQSTGGSVTLYEAPNMSPHTPTARKRSESNREGEEQRGKIVDGASKNKPPKEGDLHAPWNFEFKKFDSSQS
ncbi:hypothetical protein ACFE04_016987 [Oxalis oulophora]